MYGLTRGTVTLLGAAVAGLLIWLATQINDHSTGGYWAVYGLIAAAGLTMARRAGNETFNLKIGNRAAQKRPGRLKRSSVVPPERWLTRSRYSRCLRF